MSARRSWLRPTIRVRLTLLYAAAFFLAGAMLLALIYFQLGMVLNRQLILRTNISTAVAEEMVGPPGAPPGQPPGLPPRARRDAQGPLMETLDFIGVELARARRGTLERMLISSIIFLGVVGVIACILGWGLAGQALHPLRRITATARRVADRNLHERISLEGPNDEIKELADTLDFMFDRLDQAFDSQQRFIANASHELRTPLAINRTLIEVALLEEPQPDKRLRQLCSTLLSVNQRNERLLDGLLTLASSEQRIVDPTPVDLADIAGHVAAEYAPGARDAKVEIRTDLQPAPVLGELVLLERVAENLIENAIRYNLPDGWIRIATETAGDRAAFVIENTGPIIPPSDVPRLFEPFQRLSGSERRADPAGGSMTRGAGLGLSIVRTVARAHGGEAMATPRKDGGLILRVSMPAYRGPHPSE